MSDNKRISTDPNKIDLYGGLAGCELEIDNFDFGQGITISKTFARLSMPFIVSFAQAKKNNPFGGCIRAASGGFGFVMHTQLYLPKDIKVPDDFDLLNTGWLFAALLRLRTTPRVILVLYSSAPFVEGGDLEREMELWPVEVEPRALKMGAEGTATISEADLKWVKKYWMPCGMLMRRNPEFNLAVQTFARSQFARSSSMALLAMWGALESLFSPARNELSFRISSNIAVFLEPPGEGRVVLQEKVARLYSARCSAAHSSEEKCEEPLLDTYFLMKRVIIKIIEENHIPTRRELKARMFGGKISES